MTLRAPVPPRAPPPRQHRAWSWRSPATRALLWQALALVGLLADLLWLVHNTQVNMAARGIQSGWDFLGQTALTREPVSAHAVALGEVTVLEIERDDVEELVRDKPALLHEIGRAIDERRGDVRRVLEAIQPDRATVGTNEP